MKKRSLRILEYCVVVIPFLVACSQFVLYKTSDLTLWKGGGFGMYSNPHPYSSLHVWITGENVGEEVFLRLHKLDTRLDLTQIENQALSDNLLALGGLAGKMRYFPSLMSKQKLDDSYADVLMALKNDPDATSIIPLESVKLVVTELTLTPDYKQIELIPIYEHDLVP